MSIRLVKVLAPALLVLTAGSADAQFRRGNFGGGYGGGTYNNGYGYGVYGPQTLGGYGMGSGGIGYGGYGFGSSYYGGYGSGGYGQSYYRGSTMTYPSGGAVYAGSGYVYPAATAQFGNPVGTGTGVIQAGGFVMNPSPTMATSPAPATVTLVVPDGAQVWFDGKESDGTGTSRKFTSPTLQPGQSSVLSVKARWGGSTREMQLPIQAGDKTSVDLSQQ